MVTILFIHCIQNMRYTLYYESESLIHKYLQRFIGRGPLESE